jgi:hypothetical protein
MITIDFTYQTVTPESAEHGDESESGFILPGMWKYPVLAEYSRQEWKPGTLAQFVSFAQSLGICTCEGCDWLYSVDPDIDYQTGEETTYSMHIDGCTDASRERIYRLLTGDSQ